MLFRYEDTYYDDSSHIEYGRYGREIDCGPRGTRKARQCSYNLLIEEIKVDKIAKSWVIKEANEDAAKAASVMATLNEMARSNTGLDLAKRILGKKYLDKGTKTEITYPKIHLGDMMAECLHRIPTTGEELRVTVATDDTPDEDPNSKRYYKGIAEWDELMESNKYRLMSPGGKEYFHWLPEFEDGIRFTFKIVRNGNNFRVLLASDWYPFALYPQKDSYSVEGLSIDNDKLHDELTKVFEDIILAQVPEYVEIQEQIAEEEAAKEAKRIEEMGGRDYVNDHKSGGHNPFAGLFG